jgi:hypothetical protein
MLVYIASEQNLSMFDDICKTKNLIADKMTGVYDLRQIVSQQTANFNHCTYFATDLSSLQNQEGEIADALAAFAAMYPKARMIAVYLGADDDSKLARDLNALGVHLIISHEPTEQRREIAAAFSNLSPLAEIPEPRTVIKEVIREIPAERQIVQRLKQRVTVGVCGAGARVGATTQAFHIIKYLIKKGARACYADFSDSGNVLAHHKIYGGIRNAQSGYLSYGGMELFYKPNLPLIVSMGYEFIVMDFGVFQPSILQQGYITSDVRIAVSGVKPLEMGGLVNLFNAVDVLDGIHFIFSFAPEAEHAYILEQMDALAGNTHFAPYAPSYFEPGDTAIYDKILGEYLQAPQEPPPQAVQFRKKPVFGFLRRGG